MRKIIQISGNPCVTALCDDGTVWLQSIIPDEKMNPVFSWIRFPEVPQDELEQPKKSEIA